MADTTTTTDDRQKAIQAARESFSGRSLTENQLKEAWAISSIINQEIHNSGTFREKLTDYAHAFARNEKFDAMRGETILRDVYTARYGQSMNKVREGLSDTETEIGKLDKTQSLALQSAESIKSMIKDGSTQPFYKAYETAASSIAKDLNITQVRAKSLMKEAYKNEHGRELYESCKVVEEAYHKPIREAEIAAYKAEKLENSVQPQSRRQSRS